VFVTAIEPPKLSEGKLRLALPNLLEERLLADAQDCHFAFMVPRGGTGTTTIAAMPKMPVAVIDRGVLTHALDACTEAGYRVRAAYSEIYTMPAPSAGVLSVRADRGRGSPICEMASRFSWVTTSPAALLRGGTRGQAHPAYGREAARVSALAASLGCRSTSAPAWSILPVSKRR
jgi:hypothetical protein